MSEDTSLTATYRGLLPNLGRVEALLSQILDLEGVESFTAIDPSATPEIAYNRDHAFATARLLRHRLSTIDPLLVSDGGLANLHNYLSSELNELRAFAANKNPGHLSNARAQLDANVFPLFWTFFPENGTGPLDSVQLELVRTVQERATEAIRALVSEQTDALTLNREKAGKAIEDVTNAQSKALDTFGIGVVEVQARAAKAADEVAMLAQQITQQRADNAATTAKLEKEFSEAEQARAEKFAALLEDLTNNHRAQLIASTIGAEEALGRLHAHEVDVVKLVEAIGMRGITANYAVIAERELLAANRWRWATVAFFVLGIAIAAYIFFKILPASLDHLNLGEIALRFGFALAITAPALYTARESARHRTTGDRATQAQMELASLGPFIANLDRDSQDSIRRDLVDKYFGREHEAHSAEPPIKLKEVSNLAVELVKATREVADKKR